MDILVFKKHPELWALADRLEKGEPVSISELNKARVAVELPFLNMPCRCEHADAPGLCVCGTEVWRTGEEEYMERLATASEPPGQGRTEAGQGFEVLLVTGLAQRVAAGGEWNHGQAASAPQQAH